MSDLKMTTTGDYMTPQQVIDYLLAENGTFPERKAARMAAERIMHQQAEIDALKAHVERLLKACQSAHSSYGKTLLSDPPQDAWKANQVTAKLVEAITSTPKQFLAEHDSE